MRIKYIKQIDSMLPWVCSVIDHRRRQNVVRTSVTHSAIASCATFLFLPHFDVICDLLLNRHTATWNLFVKYIDFFFNGWISEWCKCFATILYILVLFLVLKAFTTLYIYKGIFADFIIINIGVCYFHLTSKGLTCRKIEPVTSRYRCDLPGNFSRPWLQKKERYREVTGSNSVEFLNFSGFSTQLLKLSS